MNEPITNQGNLEIIVETYEDVLAAVRGGATQLDLKAHYPCSGVSPSAGIIARVLRAVDIPVMVMVRPHARSLVMSREDINTACEEIRQARKLGANNFVVGFLNSGYDLDMDGLMRIKEAAGDCALHANLIWELSNDPMNAIEQLIELGFSSLRAGGKTASSGAFGGSVVKAISTILAYKNAIADRIQILLAGGVNESNIEEIILKTGIIDLHCGRFARTPESADSPVDEEKVSRLRAQQIKAIYILNKNAFSL
jgi:copper homeostasis protein